MSVHKGLRWHTIPMIMKGRNVYVWQNFSNISYLFQIFWFVIEAKNSGIMSILDPRQVRDYQVEIQVKAKWETVLIFYTKCI